MHKKIFFLVGIIFLACSSKIRAQKSSIKSENNFLAEAIGYGGYPSASAEFLVGDAQYKFGLKLGFGFVWSFNSYTHGSYGFEVVPSIPLQIVGVFGGQNSNLELGVGATYFHKLIFKDQVKQTLPTVFVGYRHWLKPRLAFRVGGGAFFSLNEIILNPTLGIAYSLTGRISR